MIGARGTADRRTRAARTLAALLLPAAALAAVVSARAESASSPFRELIPKPVSAVAGDGSFLVQPTTIISVRPGSAELVRMGRYLADRIAETTGYELEVSRAREGATSGAILLATQRKPVLGGEGYELRSSRAGISVVANGSAGVFRGVQTLRQLFPAAAPWKVQAGVVRDRPRFAWRGMMLDVARHFIGVDDVKRLVDLAALYKLNRLHLHLTDDQGWRLAIRSWPKLATLGGATQVGGGPGGYYTQAQYSELVEYAASRYVVVIPEIDMPGHTNAALSSYPELTCDGIAPQPYTGIEVGFSSLCIGKPTVRRFVEDVVREVAALTPGPYLHVGGDEAKATPRHAYREFLEHAQDVVRANGKRMIGWEEIASARLLRRSIAQHWHSGAQAQRAAARGVKLLMSPAEKAYLDMKYDPRTAQGLSWAGHTSVRDAYAWDPATRVPGVGEDQVVGVEAPLWSETVATRVDLDLLVFPRLLGHAEIGWSPAAGRSWGEYRRRLAAHGRRLEALGVDFYRSPDIPWR